MKAGRWLAGCMTLALAALAVSGCGLAKLGFGNDSVPGSAAAQEVDPLQGKLVVWTYYEQAQEAGRMFMQAHPGVQVTVRMIAGDQYRERLEAVLASDKNVPDLFDLEQSDLGAFINSPELADLSALGAESLLTDYIPYVAALGRSADGKVRAVSDQSSPGGFWYNRKTARAWLGTDDPDKIGRMVKGYEQIAELGERVNRKSGGKVKLIADAGDLTDIAAYNREPLVKDGRLHIDPEWEKLYQLQLQIRRTGGDAGKPFLAAGWGDGLNKGSVVLSAMPDWASFMVDNEGGRAEGKFGVAATPEGFYSGGTYRSIYAGSRNKELAYAFIAYTAGAEWQTYNLRRTGSMPASRKVYERQAASFEQPLLGDQKVMALYEDSAASIPARQAVPGDEPLLEAWRKAVRQGLADDAPYEKVEAAFRKKVKASYPEIRMD